MPLSLVNNISSSNAIRRLSGVTSDLSRTQEQLSSGLRITRPSDDAAGLSISKGLDIDAKVYSQGLRNVNDAVGLLNTAEGAVSELSAIVTRQRELAEQAANGVYSGRQRAALNAEANALVNEYNRIVRSTAFNSLSIIDGVGDSFTTQQGYGTAENTTIGVAQSLGTAAGNGLFTSQSLDVAGAPISAAGDLNGDSNVDLVTFDTTTSTAFVTTGTATGSFNTPVTVPFGIQVSAVSLADLNNDGYLDIIATSNITDRVYVIRGNGNGTFQAAISLPGTATDPVDVAIRDLNSDGNLDIVAISSTTNIASVYLGNGNMTFQTGVNYTAISGVTGLRSVTIADFNGDGVMDVATGTQTPATGGVMLGNSNGTFKAPSNFSFSGSDIAHADFNGDGIMDLAGVRGSAVHVALGVGDGTFLPNTDIGGFATVVSIVTGDFNGDGWEDIATASSVGGAVYTSFSNGNGTFLAPVSSSAIAPVNLVTGDFNRDGIMDLVADRAVGTDRTTVLTGSADTSGRRNNFQYRLDLLTINSARDALTTLEAYQSRINLELGRIGAFQSRLSSAVINLENRRVNYRDAQSQIEDVDVADASARLVSQKILQQSAAAVLAQANQQPKLALALLGKSAPATDN